MRWKFWEKCEHEFIPIRYGFLTKAVDSETGEIIVPKDFYEGGCAIKEEKFICRKCKKRFKELEEAKKSKSNGNLGTGESK